MQMTDMIWDALESPDTPRKLLAATRWNLHKAKERLNDTLAFNRSRRYLWREEMDGMAKDAAEVSRCRSKVRYAIRMWREIGPDSFLAGADYNV